MTKNFSFLFLALVFWACHERNSNDPKAVKEEMRQREIVHATPAQISERAFQLGDTLCRLADKVLIDRILKSKDTTCLPAFKALEEWFAKAHEVNLVLVGFEKSGFEKLVSAKEKEVFDAILYNQENHLAIQPNLQKDGEKDFIFTKALVMKDKSCQKCLQQLSHSVQNAKIGDTLGIWKVRIPKRKVILSFVD